MSVKLLSPEQYYFANFNEFANFHGQMIGRPRSHEASLTEFTSLSNVY